MFWLQEAAEKTTEHAGESAEHVPIVVQFVNHYFGEWAYKFEMNYTYPYWTKFFAKFHTTPEAVFGPYTPETAIPWYTVMFVIACILSVAIIWILKGQLSEEEPGYGQQTLELGVLAIRSMLEDIIGPHGLQYFPVVMTFAVLILVSNLMGLFPLFMSPTAAVSVTFALGLSSFLYYNWVGIKENGLVGHVKHLAGPIWWIAPLIFPIELISNFIRPFSLGIRLFGNMFADEKVSGTVAGLYPQITHWIIPVFIMPLGIFVAFIQTFVFVLLSQLYLSEVSHGPHDEHEEHDAATEHDQLQNEREEAMVPVLT
ncbi:MAG TPA: ATP synthase F0 subunit A [Blastocatellia bacterium]|jgi:F-type H+-transporting ATPase subunit a|nr:ATP synthase F0 subunit A [Blastocatellia bacterium]HAF21717.1 ATP synthase F0 subunit A [Blastocatellia bacterium]